MTEEKVRVVTVNVTSMLYQMRQAGMTIEADFVQALVNGTEQ